MARIPNIVIDGAHIFYKNFGGDRDDYNPGKRSVCVVIEDPEMAEQLRADGWNVKTRPARDPEDPPINYIKVEVKFGKYPPNVIMITELPNGDRRGIRMNEDTVRNLDTADIENIDLVISPSRWEMGNKSGIKAYLKDAYVTIRSDALTMKYADLDIR